ncbi:MAG: hypothetical protein OXT65_06405 [Alphaproteobacteria bacterium]|nr:hypothetical protein [Alphaproteobacteria bacterium]
MTDEENLYYKALSAIPDARLHIAEELKAMADGGAAYPEFADVSPYVKNIWWAAAELLKRDDQQTKRH